MKLGHKDPTLIYRCASMAGACSLAGAAGVAGAAGTWFIRTRNGIYEKKLN